MKGKKTLTTYARQTRLSTLADDDQNYSKFSKADSEDHESHKSDEQLDLHDPEAIGRFFDDLIENFTLWNRNWPVYTGFKYQLYTENEHIDFLEKIEQEGDFLSYKDFLCKLVLKQHCDDIQGTKNKLDQSRNFENLLSEIEPEVHRPRFIEYMQLAFRDQKDVKTDWNLMKTWRIYFKIHCSQIFKMLENKSKAEKEAETAKPKKQIVIKKKITKKKK